MLNPHATMSRSLPETNKPRDDAWNDYLALNRPPRVLLAEDDTEMRRSLAEALRYDGYHVSEVADGIALLVRLRNGLNADLIVSDVKMPGRSGVDVLSELRAYDRETPVILITAFATHETIQQAQALGAATVLSKPFGASELRYAVRGLFPGASVPCE